MHLECVPEKDVTEKYVVNLGGSDCFGWEHAKNGWKNEERGQCAWSNCKWNDVGGNEIRACGPLNTFE